MSTIVGQPKNAWGAAATGAAGTSAAVALLGCRLVSVFGHTDGATTFTVQLSADGVTFYDSGTTNAPSGAADFGFTFDCAAPFVRLKSSSDRTVTATIAAA